ncbi:hypothetical protein BC826DRAFT_1052408 [Russula brevipes]|nr:hypothetical protein BC826DRAFT_1052408 [Russula brevipes]
MTRDVRKARAQLPEARHSSFRQGKHLIILSFSILIYQAIPPNLRPLFCNSISFILPQSRRTGTAPIPSHRTRSILAWLPVVAEPGCPSRASPSEPETHAEDVSAQTRIRISGGGFVFVSFLVFRGTFGDALSDIEKWEGTTHYTSQLHRFQTEFVGS